MRKFLTLTLLILTIMANAARLVPTIEKWEGGFANHPNDKGGATNRGVTIATFRGYYGKDKTVEDLKNMTYDQWFHIYKTGFWDRWRADSIRSQAIANLLVDWVWASGAYGIKYPQQVLGVTADGIVGAKTLAAINNHPHPHLLFKQLWERRKRHFDDIVRSNPSQKVFYNGWIRRLNDFKWFDDMD